MAGALAEGATAIGTPPRRDDSGAYADRRMASIANIPPAVAEHRPMKWEAFMVVMCFGLSEIFVRCTTYAILVVTVTL